MDAKIDAANDGQAALSDADIDAFIRRNRDELNRSIAEARTEFTAGAASTLSIEEIIARCAIKR